MFDLTHSHTHSHQIVHKWTVSRNYNILLLLRIINISMVLMYIVYDLVQGENQLHGTRSCGFRQLVVVVLLVPMLVEIMVEMVKSRNKTNQKGGQKVP